MSIILDPLFIVGNEIYCPPSLVTPVAECKQPLRPAWRAKSVNKTVCSTITIFVNGGYQVFVTTDQIICEKTKRVTLKLANIELGKVSLNLSQKSIVKLKQLAMIQPRMKRMVVQRQLRPVHTRLS